MLSLDPIKNASEIQRHFVFCRVRDSSENPFGAAKRLKRIARPRPSASDWLGNAQK